MPGPHPAVALTRRAVRAALSRPDGVDAGARSRCLIIGVSGGADSLALAAAVAFEAPKLGLEARAVVVDHGLQSGSDDVARRAADTCAQLGLDAVVRRVRVADAGGPEAAARAARYASLWAEARGFGAARLLVAHTGDDQAEQVLLGLVRGSGTRSLAGMRVERDGLLRPFLLGPPVLRGGPVMRSDTRAACVALGLNPWDDPHNFDDRYARVRARSLLRDLEQGLAAPTLRRSLVRTAESAARDADLLDRLTYEALAAVAGQDDPTRWPMRWPAHELAALDPALRIRAVRRLALLGGARAAELTSTHLHEIEQLLVGWRGQGPVDLPGRRRAVRRGGEVAIEGADREE